MEVNNRLNNVIASVLEMPPEHINDDSSPDTVEKWDSLKQMALVVALEEEFAVTFSDEQIAEMLNVKLIRMVVEEALKKAS